MGPDSFYLPAWRCFRDTSSLPSAFAVSVVLWLGDPFSTGHVTVSSELIAKATGVPSVSQQERKLDIPKAKSLSADSVCLLVVAELRLSVLI